MRYETNSSREHQLRLKFRLNTLILHHNYYINATHVSSSNIYLAAYYRTYTTSCKMKLLQINNSLATFQMPCVKFIYSDPYNNTFGENNWDIISIVLILCILIIFGNFLGNHSYLILVGLS